MLIFGRPVLHVYLELDSQPYTVEKPVPRTTGWNGGGKLNLNSCGIFSVIKPRHFGSQESLDSRHVINLSSTGRKIPLQELSDSENRMFIMYLSLENEGAQPHTVSRERQAEGTLHHVGIHATQQPTSLIMWTTHVLIGTNQLLTRNLPRMQLGRHALFLAKGGDFGELLYHLSKLFLISF